jgi:hypothetical protein
MTESKPRSECGTRSEADTAAGDEPTTAEIALREASAAESRTRKPATESWTGEAGARKSPVESAAAESWTREATTAKSATESAATKAATSEAAAKTMATEFLSLRASERTSADNECRGKRGFDWETCYTHGQTSRFESTLTDNSA